MSRYNDPRVLEWARHHGGRKSRALRELKRLEADERNARTLPHKRAAYWRELDVTQLDPDGPCHFPWKHAFPNRDAALATWRRLPKHRRGQGLHPYPCAGHFHLGRDLARASVAWRAFA